MKYDHNSRIPKDWADSNLGKLLSDLKLQIFDKNFKNTNYMIGQHNLLKNNGIVEYD